MPELILIMVLALILFGPKKLPEIGKSVGKALGEFKRASNDLKRTIEDEMEKVKADEPVRPVEVVAPTAVASAIPRSPETTVAPAVSAAPKLEAGSGDDAPIFPS